MNKLSPKVVFKTDFIYAFNNPDRWSKNKEKTLKKINGMFDYYADEKKGMLNMFDYFTGKLTKKEKYNLMLENGEYATDEDIKRRKEEYEKYIENSNLWRGIISFPTGYLDNKIKVEDLENELVKTVLPMLFKRIGFSNPKNMSYQIALHTDTDNLHFHFSFVEKKPNFNYPNKKIGYRRKGVIDTEDMNFLKNEVQHVIEKEKYYKPLLIKTNKELDELKTYFKTNEKNFIIYDKKDMVLEENILKLGELLYKRRLNNDKKIKFNSIDDKEIKELTFKIKRYIFSKNNNDFKKEYSSFKDSLKEINNYFEKINKSNNINDKVDKSLVENKEKYLENFIYNAIVNHAFNEYKGKKKKVITENNIIEEIILKEYINNNLDDRFNILKKYLSNSQKRYQNKRVIENSIKNINYELEIAKDEFSKLFQNKFEKEL